MMARWRSLLASGPALAAAGGIFLSLLVGLAAGQDYNYDLENYHFATAHLLLTGGLDRNVAPSGLQSWFNPIGYVPLTLAIKTLAPPVVSVLLAILGGLNAPLIYLIADRAAADLPDRARRGAALLCTLIGMTGAIVMSEAATSFLDNVLSMAELGALLLVIRAGDTPGVGSRWLLGWAGLLLGLASGLKLTVAVFAIAMAGVVLVAIIGRRLGSRSMALFAMGGLIGFVITGGWWAWHLWRETGNPVFPMANDLFRSPLAPLRPLNDTSYLAKGWADLLANPWHWLIGDRTPGAEITIRDPRYALALLSATVALVLARWLRFRSGWAAGAISGFILLAYALWLLLFGILRYALALEMLSGVAILAVLVLLPRLAPQTVIGVLILVALSGIGWTRSGNWGRVPFTSDWFGVTGIAEVHRPGTLYIMPDDSPLAFMVGLFPADARFAHIGGNFPLDPAIGFGPHVVEMIRRAPFIRTLAAAPNNAEGVAALRRFGLVEVPGSCRPIQAKIALAESCRLRTAGRRASAFR